MYRTILTILISVMCFSSHAKGATKHKDVPVSLPESFVVASHDGTTIKEQGSDTIRPIASISKLMVSLLASEQEQDEQLYIPHKRIVSSGIPSSQTSLSRHELLTLALVKSDNFAAQILCENIFGCVEKMNDRAIQLGMNHTHFEEPTGLSRENVSTANDLLKLIIHLSDNRIISTLSRMPTADISYGKKTIKINNTNPLTKTLDIILSKTGFTNPAGGCLVIAVNSPLGKRFLVLLGSRNTKTRIPEMEKLYKDTL